MIVVTTSTLDTDVTDGVDARGKYYVYFGALAGAGSLNGSIYGFKLNNSNRITELAVSGTSYEANPLGHSSPETQAVPKFDPDGTGNARMIVEITSDSFAYLGIDNSPKYSNR